MKQPRIAIVARRDVRKDKYIDYVGEFHLDLIARFNALPIIIPRIANVKPLIASLIPFIDGLLLTEGSDIGPNALLEHGRTSSIYESEPTEFTTPDVLAAAHPSDAIPDINKDSIESTILGYCLSLRIPIFAICRGSQLLNVFCGGTLQRDVEGHMDYENYDGFRHAIKIIPNTPISKWFNHEKELNVSSYHHQSVGELAERFTPMAYSHDGIIEAFYDKHSHFVMGIQFHPERMQDMEVALRDEYPVFEHDGCTAPYEDFINAAKEYRAGQQIKFDSIHEPLSSDQVNTLVHVDGRHGGGGGIFRGGGGVVVSSGLHALDEMVKNGKDENFKKDIKNDGAMVEWDMSLNSKENVPTKSGGAAETSVWWN